MRTSNARVKLPQAHTDHWEWQLRAACRSVPTSIFFLPPRLTRRVQSTREQNAKHICAQCPVIEQCLRHAIDCNEPYGIWGGLTVHERAALSNPIPSPAPVATHAIGPPRRRERSTTPVRRDDG